MGYRFTSSTWRAPIQLIDSWLPSPGLSDPPRKTSRMAQLFNRTGWLKRAAANTPTYSTCAGPEQTATAPVSRPCVVRILRQADTVKGAGPDARVVISGRISDVCAELDRLASLESRQRLHS